MKLAIQTHRSNTCHVIRDVDDNMKGTSLCGDERVWGAIYQYGDGDIDLRDPADVKDLLWEPCNRCVDALPA